MSRAASKTGESVTVDARGLRCPMPVLRLARILREHPQTGRVHLLADDPAAARDVPAFAEEMDLDCKAVGAGEWQIARRVDQART
ncbi:hypothetical protein B5C34_06910 [Pacificimonas flava]|uniref:UPF0033 domain-containing protein n=2 Tax=Pacificimonas TaxID=1960290 RepID=A0A219B4Y5_9SPHN|nr:MULTISPECIES: sulfurtransferase TusA family protein [Pacificimonas]MBZ6377046.1 sulfurtransferase TusA family protein [Pacificimonas aurantium]OWV33213.1 hypothetical protein B5C34_06910 [Pacificimonas flava]